MALKPLDNGSTLIILNPLHPGLEQSLNCKNAIKLLLESTANQVPLINRSVFVEKTDKS